MLILVIVKEDSPVQPQAIVEQVRLYACLIGYDDFRFEWGRRGSVIGGEPARLYAARYAGVEQGVLAQIVFRADAAADFRQVCVVGGFRPHRRAETTCARRGKAARLVFIAQARNQVQALG
ncbi:hypothetical protein D3C80_1504700 [compost metagenome]